MGPARTAVGVLLAVVVPVIWRSRVAIVWVFEEGFLGWVQVL